MFQGRRQAPCNDAGSTRTGPMNALIVGKNKSDLFSLLPERFLLIDDGEFSNELTFPDHHRVTKLDLTRHHYNPLKGIDYRRARELSQILYAAYPQGEDTLTVRNGRRALTKLLLAAKRLDAIARNPRDPYISEATATIDDLLLSPILSAFLSSAANFPVNGTILANLDRSSLPEVDAFIVGNVLSTAYAGQVVVPDLGFYACALHLTLIRQERLIAGLNFLDEVPPALSNRLLLVSDKRAAHCTARDAEMLASYRGLIPGTNAHTDFVHRSVDA